MSLIPEKSIIFSPTLAATLGLEEAILLQILQECASHSEQVASSGFAWTSIPGQKLLELSPFWNEQDIRRLTASLHEKGLLLVGGGAFQTNQEFRFAFNESSAASSSLEVRNRSAQFSRPRHIQQKLLAAAGNPVKIACDNLHSWGDQRICLSNKFLNL
jgi:hypothetical protein